MILEGLEPSTYCLEGSCSILIELQDLIMMLFGVVAQSVLQRPYGVHMLLAFLIQARGREGLKPLCMPNKA